MNETKIEISKAIEIFKESKTLSNLKHLLEISKLKTYPICYDCGNPMLHPNTNFRFSKLDELKHEGTQKLIKTINDVDYPVLRCHSCIVPHLSERTLRKKKWYNMFGEAVKIACDIPDEALKTKHLSTAVTLENLQSKYGLEDGQKRYESYCKKQGDKNKFEHKKEKHGWTEEQFREFNLSRASTKENFIKRHGKEKGTAMWNEYCEWQGLTSKNEYTIKNQSPERLAYIIEARQRTFKWCMTKCNNDRFKADEMYTNINRFGLYSKKSIDFFDRLLYKVEELSGIQIRFAKYAEDEISIVSGNDIFFYDFCLDELNMIIEYHGTVWHADPTKYINETYVFPHQKKRNRIITANEIWAKDAKKQLAAESNGYEYHVIWEREDKDDDIRLVELANIIIEKLNDKNTKENKIWDSSYSQ